MTGKPPKAAPPIAYDSSLIEAVVRRRVDRASDKDTAWIKDYRAEMDELYESAGADRETAFAALDRRYFNRIGISAVVDECMAEEAEGIVTSSIAVLPAHSAAEEGADVTKDGRLVLRFRLSTLDDLDSFRSRLRREVIQAADCFDPRFGHDPDLLNRLLPSEQERIRTGLRVLWALSAQRRLCGRYEKASECVPEDLREGLAQLARQETAVFGRDSAGRIGELMAGLPDRAPSFLEMFEFCRAHLGSEAVAAGICDLCRFPSEDAVFLHSLDGDTAASLKAEFPNLHDHAQICLRCVERTRSERGCC